MEELKIEHLAPYLPYKLKFLCTDGYEHEMVGLELVDILLISHQGDFGRVNINTMNIKPLLYPLSHLTKEIEVNGERFVPIAEFWKMNHNLDKIGEFKANISDCEAYIKSNHLAFFFDFSADLRNVKFWIIKKLFEWHFDVNSLIEKGLAIDKTTL
jgi:hypothetical protein